LGRAEKNTFREASVVLECKDTQNRQILGVRTWRIGINKKVVLLAKQGATKTLFSSKYILGVTKDNNKGQLN